MCIRDRHTFFANSAGWVTITSGYDLERYQQDSGISSNNKQLLTELPAVAQGDTIIKSVMDEAGMINTNQSNLRWMPVSEYC